MTVDQLSVVLVLIAFAVLLIRAVMDYRHNHNLLQSYTGLIQGVVSNAGLTRSLETRYRDLTPEQRRYADFAFDLIDTLSKATPTEADNVLADWTKRVREGMLGETIQE